MGCILVLTEYFSQSDISLVTIAASHVEPVTEKAAPSSGAAPHNVDSTRPGCPKSVGVWTPGREELRGGTPERQRRASWQPSYGLLTAM